VFGAAIVSGRRIGLVPVQLVWWWLLEGVRELRRAGFSASWGGVLHGHELPNI